MKKYMMCLFAILSTMLVFCGCSDTESNHPMLKKAGQSMRMGEYRNAELCYKKYLAKNPAAASVHYALANLYDEHLEEYLLAVYHYKESLRLQPDASEETARNIENFIKRCEQKYVQKGKPVKKVFLTDEQEIARMTAAYKKKLAEQQKKADAELARLKKEEAKLKKQQLAAQNISDSTIADKKAEKKEVKKEEAETDNKAEKTEEKTAVENKSVSEKITPDTPVVSEKNTPDTPLLSENVKPDSPAVSENIMPDSAVKNAATPVKEQKQEVIKDFSKLPSMSESEKVPEKDETVKEYKVKRGDTFSHLSRKFYGSVRYYKLLMQYNKISSPNALRVGKILKVPPLHILKGEKDEK